MASTLGAAGGVLCVLPETSPNEGSTQRQYAQILPGGNVGGTSASFTAEDAYDQYAGTCPGAEGVFAVWCIHDTCGGVIGLLVSTAHTGPCGTRNRTRDTYDRLKSNPGAQRAPAEPTCTRK